jgi:hypothetical protein
VLKTETIETETIEHGHRVIIDNDIHIIIVNQHQWAIAHYAGSLTTNQVVELGAELKRLGYSYMKLIGDIKL